MVRITHYLDCLLFIIATLPLTYNTNDLSSMPWHTLCFASVLTSCAGLTNCMGGVGSTAQARSCNHPPATLRAEADGWLTYVPEATHPAKVIDELDLLLTGGRLSSTSRDLIVQRYEQVLQTTGSSAEALAASQVISTHVHENPIVQRITTCGVKTYRHATTYFCCAGAATL